MSAARPHVCTICQCNGVAVAPSFPTEKDLLSHKRAKHGIKCNARLYIDSDATCPVCLTQFGSRLRAIAHLSDQRRTQCSSQLLRLTLVHPERVASLDALDRAERREAQRDGKSHPRARAVPFS